MTGCLPGIIIDHAPGTPGDILRRCTVVRISSDSTLHGLSVEPAPVLQASFSFRMTSMDRASASARLRIGSVDIMRTPSTMSDG